MRTFSIRTEVAVRFTFPGLADSEYEVAHPTLDIQFTYTPGSPARGPSYSSGGEPADPAEVEIISAKIFKPDGLGTPDDATVMDWANGWLDTDAGYNEACNAAETQMQPDPDEAYERMRDDRDFWAGQQEYPDEV